MITRSMDIDLGRDKDRIKDPRDAVRQAVTAECILSRFFANDYSTRMPIQVLADEVGMGKTYVALAAAFSILQAMRNGVEDEDLRGCYQRILIITPSNQLLQKWMNETGEFVNRCVSAGKAEAAQWFYPKKIERVDELAMELRKSGSQPRILVTTMTMPGGKIRDYDLKRRFLLGLLFRYWGNKFRYDHRWNLLKGAPEGWARNPDQLLNLSDREREVLSFDENEAMVALERADRRSAAAGNTTTLEQLLEVCREIAEPYRRDRDECFKEVEQRLVDLYKDVSAELIIKDFPLVIVDEAHNWKNGPKQGTNGYRGFIEVIAPHARRALLLTATPFQLRPAEMIEILKVSDGLKPAPGQRESELIRQRVADRRDNVIQVTLAQSEKASRDFARAWSRLPLSIKTGKLADLWNSSLMEGFRQQLGEVARREGHASESKVKAIVDQVQRHVEPELRHFIRAAMELFVFNEDLSQELSAIVIRHRRRTAHRLVRVGLEYLEENAGKARGREDAHVLHGACGIDVSGEGELPHYVLMRCVSEMKRLKGRHGRSSLGSALTGCYSTLLHSADGKAVKRELAGAESARKYLAMLMDMVDADQDERHPKVSTVVASTLRNWQRGEKTLIFCWRINTAERLKEILSSTISGELDKLARSCLGGEDKLKALKGRLQGRERDLIVLGLDRVLWSLLWARDGEKGYVPSFSPADLVLTDTDLLELARLSLAYGVPLTEERVDRVFLTRAIEHVLARRLADTGMPDGMRQAFEKMKSRHWIETPYGIDSESDEGDQGERSEFDERGVHTTYRVTRDPAEEDVIECKRQLAASREAARKTGQIPILDVYAKGPHLLLGEEPVVEFCGEGLSQPLFREMHRRLWALTVNAEETLNWESRRKVMQAIRRVLLRNSVLVRLLPHQEEREEAKWGELLVRSFLKPLPGQGESMANRIAVFLEDLAAANGDLAATEPGRQGARYDLYASSRLNDQFVTLVKGGSDKNRSRVFAGFNSPLLPEVLICTSVGQEGIDLHRQCRHVVHYDLAWNPAVLEQRTGRVDRLGSKTFRERDMKQEGEKPRLEVGVPFLAGTYDERMFEELRLRAQTFEVLTGGDFAADNPEGDDVVDGAEGAESGMRLVPIPDKMLADLRVRLHVYHDEELDLGTAIV